MQNFLCLIIPTLLSKLVFRRSCQSAWSDLRLSPVFGCICPNSLHEDECHQIFKTVNGNPCIGKPSLFCHPLWTPLEQELMARLGRLQKLGYANLRGTTSFLRPLIVRPLISRPRPYPDQSIELYMFPDQFIEI